MSDSIPPATDISLFLGRPPLLVVPAVVILALSVKLAPRKIIAGNCSVIPASVRFAMMFPFPVVSLCLSIFLYTFGDRESPLTVETPVTLASSNFTEARVCISFLLVAEPVLAISQLLSVPVHAIAALSAQAANTGNFWCAMMLAAATRFGFIMASIYLLFNPSPTWRQTFVQRVETILLSSQFFVLAYDLVMVAVYYRMHKGAPAESKALLYRLFGTAFLTLMIPVLTISLRSLVFLINMPQHGWLDGTLQIGGYVTALHLHMIAFFIMWNEIVKHNDAKSVKSQLTAESANPCQSDAAEMVKV
ncbi:hypothetical protein PsYK624_040690 [Phanerochaete sordida]|uniref:Transmembrane protein n=1 Tax=Phanerochaete sordida TaxID=48140 RepID=A0A9P3LA45_9APHY|nr:hypothetical protein PsYK624_040690 [Phanerochaete sordida]